MNKITPRLLRDLSATLPEGTECYLCAAVRRALSNYRNSREPAIYLNKNQALTALTQRLGRGLNRFFIEDIQVSLAAAERANKTKTQFG